MGSRAARLLIVTSPLLDPGFRLAGVGTRVAHTPAEAEETVRNLLADGEVGVIAVHRPYLDDFDPEFRSRLESLVNPVVLAVPDGLETETTQTRQARLAELLQRAVGYHIVFEEDRA